MLGRKAAVAEAEFIVSLLGGICVLRPVEDLGF